MIRDPSDGIVKEIGSKVSLDNALPQEKRSEEITSGLPATSLRSAYLARLDRSRKWLEHYRTNPEAVARLIGDTDHEKEQGE
jgi:hypothetical protein